MNHIYRSIWNDSTATYVAAAETTRSGGKKASSSTRSRQAGRGAFNVLAASLCLAYAAGASALPTGGVVTAGSANVTATPGTVTIVQGSQGVVLNWQSFGIGVGETVQFLQPNASAVALNRVVGTDPSAILGNLSANGRVFLVNPNGILFGKGASVNVGGLVASTLDLTDTDFMAGRYRFSGDSTKAVSNQGAINAPGGFVALLGAHVSNDGVIAARMGSVALAGGQAITLDVAGDGLLNIAIDQGAVNALVSNGGLIQADGGQVLLTAQAAGKLLNTVVNNTGVIQAQTLVDRNGSIKLLGDMQTGTVNAGGTLDASAPAGGHGGFVETSAALVKIDPQVRVTTAAALGLAGSWLIDPVDFTIAASGGNMTGATLTNSLKNGAVQIQSTNGTGGTAGDINVNDSVSWAANKLTLTAQNNININQPLRGSGTASLALEYGQSAVAAGNVATYNVRAEVDLPAGNNFSTRLGSDGAAVAYTVINSLGAATSTSGTDLQGLKNALNGNFVLGANIDASGTANTAVWNTNGFTPVGSTGTAFSGQFDGLGHVIDGLRIGNTTAGAGVGLFGMISSTAQVRNVGLTGVAITSDVASGTYGYAGALVGYNNAGTIDSAYVRGGTLSSPGLVAMGGLVGKNSGIISNSYNSASLSVTTNSGSFVGGLVGQAIAGSNISNSYNSGTVVVNKLTAGGLVGSNLGSITDSFNSGAVTAGVGAGGVAYSNGTGSATGSITSSYNTGAIVGAGQVGGLVGYNFLKGSVNNSFSTGSVTAGATTGTVRAYGGLVGDNRGTIANSYATGAVSGTVATGGVVGSSPVGGTITNVYSSGAVSVISGGTGTPGGVVGNLAGTSWINGGYFNATVNSSLSAIGVNSSTNATPVTAVSGLTATQMQTGSNFGAFTFTTNAGVTGNNWVIVDTDGTLNNAGGTLGATGPMLSAEYSTTVKSAHQLQLMAMDLAGNYTLGKDISAARTGLSTDVWNGGTFIPVGASTAAPFTGTLDGAGHVVSGLVVNRPGTNYAGLFGVTSGSAIVRNVGLEGGSVTGANATGALVGLNLGLVNGSYSTVSVTGGTQVGGLIGLNGTSGGVPGIVSNSDASGAVSGAGIIGGLVGSNSGTLTNNHASGTVSGGNTQGGLAGSSNGTASGNYWDTTTSGQSTSAAGTGLATAPMKLLSTYSGAAWDLAGTWIVYDTHTYPLLRAFMTPLQVNFAAGATKTYDGTANWTAPGYSYSNPNASLSGSLNYGPAGNAINAGTYAITAGGLYSDQRGYAISANAVNLVIDKLAATLTGASVASRAYDGTTAATLLGGTVTGLLAQDAGNVAFLTGTFASKDAGSGIFVTPIGSGSAGGNYSVAAGPLSGTITPKALTVTGVSVGSKSYDGTTAATVSGGSLTGLITGETLALSGQTGVFADKNAGNGKSVTVSGATLADGTGLASNYTVGNATGVTGNITPKALTVSGVTAVDKVYDGGTAAVLTGGTLTGMVGSETLGLSTLSGVFSDKNAAIGKTVTVTGGVLSDGSNGGLASNYAVGAVTGLSASITQKALTVDGLTASTKVYDGNSKATLSGGTLSGLVGGETLSLSGQTGVFSDKNAGTGKLVTVTGTTLADGTGLASNYSVANPAGVTGDITKKALTITGITATNRVYTGGTAVSLGGTVILGGLVGAEGIGVGGMVGAFADKNVGTGKAVTITGAVMTVGSNGGQVSNYTISNPTGVTANITKASISAVTSIVVDSKSYDGGLNATVNPVGATFGGIKSGDSLTVSATTATFADKNVGTAKAVTISGIALGGTDAGNYNLTSTTGSSTGNITPKALTIVGMSAVNKVYDGNTKASVSGGSISGLVGSETLGVTGLTVTFSDKNAGVGKAVTATGTTLVNGGNGGLASNYTMANPTGFTANITPKALTVTGMTAGTRVYDATTTATLSGGALSGVISGETLVLGGGSGVFGDKNVGSGKAVVVSGINLADGTGLASNYTVTNPTTVTGSITPKALTIVGMTAVDKVYDANTKATLSGGSISGLAGSETLGVTGLTAAFSDKNAGTAKTVIASGSTLVNGGNGGLASNYTITDPTGLTASITPKALTIVGMSAVNKVYDGNTKASVSGGAISGLVGSETLGVTGLTVTFSDKNAGVGKAVTATGTTLVNGGNGGLASNYTMANPTGFTANITPKALTVTGMTAGTRVYDATTTATLSGGALSGVISGETLVLGGGSGVFGDKNVGNAKAVVVSGVNLADGTGLASNYTVTNPTTVTGSITPKALTIVGMTAVDKVYDANTKATLSGGSISGLAGSETLGVTGLTAAFSDKNAGTAKTVIASGSTLVNGGNGGLASNYTITDPTGLTASITPKALTIVGMSAVNKVYDGNTKATLTGGSISGLVGSETLGVTGLTAAFSDKNAGTAKTVTASGSTLVNGGNGGLAANYTIADPTGLTASITPKALTVTGLTADTKVYDATTTATLSGGALGGLVGSETLILSGTSGVFADKNAGTGKSVIVSGSTLADGTGLASNYTVANPGSVTGTITPKLLTVLGMAASDKDYDGTTSAAISGGSLSGFIGTETVILNGLTGAFSDKNAGSGKAVSVMAGTLADGTNGGLAGNYSISAAVGLTANIAPKVLTVTGATAVDRVYDGTTTATVAGGVLSGLVGSERLGLSGLSGVFGDKNVGSGKTVTVSGAVLADGSNGGLAGNYKVASVGDATANITPATISTVSNITAFAKVYDATTQASVDATGASFNGMVVGDSLSFIAAGASFADKNVGNGKVVSVSGIELRGTDAGNYHLATLTSSGTGDITPKALTIVGIGAVNKVYDGSTQATLTGGSINGLVGSETLGVTGLTAAFSDKNAGAAKTVTASGSTLVDGGNGGLAANYTIADPTGLTASITPKALTVTGITAGTKVYDATTTSTLSGGALSGLVGGETLVLGGGSGVFGDKNVGNAKAVVVSGINLADGTGLASNYSVSNPTTVTGSITPKALTIAGMTAVDKVYDATTTATLSGGALSGLVGGETLVLGGGIGVFGDKNAGTGKSVIVSGINLADGTGLASNYSVSNPTTVTGSITPKALTIAGMTAVDKVYDATTTATLSGGALSGLVGGETLVLGGGSGVFGDKDAGTGKSVIVSGINLSDGTGLASNYSLSNPTTVTGSITPKALTIAGMTAVDKVYDATTTATLSGGALSGLVGGETLVLGGGSGVFGDKNAGTGKSVIVSGINLSNGTGLASNYSVSNPTTVTGSITPKALTIAGMTAVDKVYDATTTATLSGGALSGLVGGETLVLGGGSGVFGDKNAGTGKSVIVSGINLSNGTGLASNYSVSNPTTVTGSITPKALTIAGMTAVDKVYDATTTATLSGGALSGLVGGETLMLGGGSGVFGDKDAGTGKSVIVSGINLSNGTGLASNYSVTNPTTVTGSITPKALTIAGMTAVDKVYDATTTATLSGGALSGLVGGETLVLGGGSGVFGDKNAGTGKSVIVSGINLSNGTGLASNYSVSNPTTVTGSITPKALTIAGMTAVDKVYDTTTQATLSGGSISGLVGSETLGVTGLTAAFSDKNAGASKTVTASGATLVNGGNGGLAANYTIADPTGLTASITPKALTLVGITAVNKVYDGNMVAALSGGSLSGLAGGENLGLSGLSGAFSDKSAATGKTVTLSGASLVDGTGLAANYTLSRPGALTADISKASVTVGGITAGSKVYDGNAVARLDTTGATFSGMVSGDSLSASAASGGFVDKNAAIGKTVSVSGIALGGADAGNYSLASSTATTTADITPRALTITGMTAVNKVVDGTTVASLTGGTLTGLVGNETLGLSGSRGAFDTASAGNGKAVTVSGSTLTDGTGLASNYRASNPTGLTADITPAAVAAVTVLPDRPTASNVDASVGVNSSPFANNGSKTDAPGGALDTKPEGRKGPELQAGAGVPPGLAALRFTMTGNGIRLPAGVVPASRDGDK